MPESSRSRYTATVSVAYALLAGTWIFLSDALLGQFSDVASATWFSTVKGFTFVVVTTAALIVVLRAAPDRRVSAAPAGPGLLLAPGADGADRWSRAVTYGFAIVATMGVLAFSWGDTPSGQDVALLLLFVVIITLCALWGGLGPGFVSVGLAAAGTAWAMAPRGQFAIGSPVDRFEWVLMVASGVLISVAGGALHSSRRRAVLGARHLQTNEERYRALFESNPNPMWVYEVDTLRFLAVNDAAVLKYGFSREEFLGMSLRDIRPAADVPALVETVAAIDPAMARSGEWRHRLKSGTEIQVEVNSHGLTWDGRRARVVLASDVSDRRKAEAERQHLEAQLQQAQRMDAIGRLAGGVAHDFNNMLNVILGYADMAMARVDRSDPLHADLAEIQEAARRSAELTGQLLAFARRQTVEPKVIDLNVFIGERAKMLRRLVGEDIQFTVVPGAELWNINIDPSQLDQVLANLAVNSRDAIQGVGRITIETRNVTLDQFFIDAHAGARPGEHVLVVFSDTGSGMDRDTLARVFEPFFTTKETGRGTGLGLATVYGIVKQNGGYINVYSEPGHGTTFRLYLPRFAGEGAGQAQPADLRSFTGTETILVAEDEPQILRMAQRMLEQAGYTVLAATSPVTAALMAGQHLGPVHLLLTDVVMPTMNGRELAIRVSAARPGIKVLYMSGYTADVVAHRGVLEAGVRFIQKPFSARDLTRSVREAIDDTSYPD